MVNASRAALLLPIPQLSALGLALSRRSTTVHLDEKCLHPALQALRPPSADLTHLCSGRGGVWPRDALGPMSGPPAAGAYKGTGRCPSGAAIRARAGGDGWWGTAALHPFIVCKLRGTILFARGKPPSPGGTALGLRRAWAGAAVRPSAARPSARSPTAARGRLAARRPRARGPAPVGPAECSSGGALPRTVTSVCRTVRLSRRPPEDGHGAAGRTRPVRALGGRGAGGGARVLVPAPRRRPRAGTGRASGGRRRRAALPPPASGPPPPRGRRVSGAGPACVRGRAGVCAALRGRRPPRPEKQAGARRAPGSGRVRRDGPRAAKGWYARLSGRARDRTV